MVCMTLLSFRRKTKSAFSAHYVTGERPCDHVCVVCLRLRVCMFACITRKDLGNVFVCVCARAYLCVCRRVCVCVCVCVYVWVTQTKLC
jgi:hypothetical protein